jgi:ABC-type branched-subunit amino acid transport system substrate-binding protein
MGALADTSGTNAAFAYRQALLLAVAQVNEGLSKAGANLRFDLKIKDTHSSAISSREGALDLINIKGVKAIVSDVSADTLALARLDYDPAKPLAHKVPITCTQCSSYFLNDPTAVHPDPLTQTAYRDPENWVFRMFFVASYESSLAVQIALRRGKVGDVNGDGQFRVAVYAQQDAFGESCESGIRSAVKTLAPEGSVSTVWYDVTHDPRTYDFSEDVKRLTATDAAQKSKGPDMVYLAVLGLPTTKMIQAYRAAKATAPLQSSTSLRRNYILHELGADAEGIEGDSPQPLANNAAGQAFATAFEEVNGVPPEMPCAGTYDGAVVLMLAGMRAAHALPNPADVSPSAIRDALLGISDPKGEDIPPTPSGFAKAYATIEAGKPINYSGASGYLPWDEVGNDYPHMVHWRVEKERFIDLETYQCDPAHPSCAILSPAPITKAP